MTKTLITLPVPGSGVDFIRIEADGPNLTAEFQYWDDADTVGTLKFTRVVAFRFRNEPNSHGRILDAYDAVVEVTESEWLSQLQEKEGRRHFAVYFSNYGYLEVAARDVEQLPPRKDALESE